MMEGEWWKARNYCYNGEGVANIFKVYLNYMTRTWLRRITLPKLIRANTRKPQATGNRRLLELLLEAKLVGVTALLLAAVHGAEVETRVAPCRGRVGTMFGENRAREESGSVETRNDRATGGDHRQVK